jgi:nitroimidazol reductase NimA-like FMN-containing flavoprotein (pyridoxamine 5'-phosphate oxidase superfamily)
LKGAYDRPTIDAILDATPHCHLGYVLPDGQPIVVPTLQARMGDHVVVHASSGGKLALHAPGGWPVCITVTLIDDLVLARSGFHHSANHRSVVVVGEAAVVADHDERLAALEAITDHVVPGRWAELRRPTHKELLATAVLRLPLTEASAKIRRGPPVDDEADVDPDVWAGVVPLTRGFGAPRPAPDVAPDVPPPPSVRRLVGDVEQ